MVAVKLVGQLQEEIHFTKDEKQRAATLTEAGIKKMEELLGVENIYTERGFEEVHHIEQALKAGYGGAAKNNGAFKPDSAWFKTPRPMCVSRASSELARMVYGDILAGLYTPEELQDAREANRG